MSADDLAGFEETVEQLFDDAPVGYVSFTADRTIVRANRTVLRWLGMDDTDVIGQRSFSDLVSGGGRIYLETHIFPLLALEGEVREIALELVRHDGSRLPVLVNIRTEAATEQRPRVHRATVFDATERRSYERELLSARREADGTAARLALLRRASPAALAGATSTAEVASVVADATSTAFGVNATIVWFATATSCDPCPRRRWPPSATPSALSEDAEVPHWRALRTGTIIKIDHPEAPAPSTSPTRSVGPVAVGVSSPFHRVPRVLGRVELQGCVRQDKADRADLSLLQAVADLAGAALGSTTLYETQHDIALTLQRSLIVHRLPADERVGFEARYLPATAGVEVGGDWYRRVPHRRPSDRARRRRHHGAARSGGGDGDGSTTDAARALSQSGFGPSRTLEHLDTFAGQLPDAQHTTLVCAELEVPTGLLRYASRATCPPLLMRRDTARFLFDGRSAPLAVPGNRPRPRG